MRLSSPQISLARRVLLGLVSLAAPLAAAQLGQAPLKLKPVEDEATSSARKAGVEAALAEPLIIRGAGEGGGAEPLSVPRIVVERNIVYSLGATKLEERKMRVFLQEEIKKRVEAGEPAEKFEITDEMFAAEMELTRKRVAQEYPGRTAEEILESRGVTESVLRAQIEQTKLFDMVFLPEDPRTWPDTTVAAIQSKAGPDFIAKLTESYIARQEDPEQGGPDQTDSGHLMWKNIMRQFVVGALNESAAIKRPTDGLPPEVAMEVNGQKIMTADVFADVLETTAISAFDVNRARLWFAKTQAVENELRAHGALLDDEAFAAAWAKEEEPYQNSPFSLQMIAVGFRKFPSIDAYKRYFHLLSSYKAMIADEMTDENLEAHMSRANPMLGLGRVQADFLMLSAYDMKQSRLRPNGWADAAQRASDVARKLADGLDWDAAMDEFSDYEDPLVPESQKGMAKDAMMNKGRFKLQHRNELVQKVGESDYWMFLSGSSVVDHVFFDQPVGSIDGPFKGLHGYYITKVQKRTSPNKPLSLDNPQQRELVEQDYLTVRFNAFAAGVLENSGIEGVEPL